MSKYYTYMASEDWKQKRTSVQHVCNICGRTDHIQIHHKSYKNVTKKKKKDLIALCAECHSDVHGYIQRTYHKKYWASALYCAIPAYKKERSNISNKRQLPKEAALKKLTVPKHILRKKEQP